jgi:hypothetical protein
MNWPNYEKDGWHDFTLEQAKEYIAEVKADQPRAWTGIFRCAEEMTTLAEDLRARNAELVAVLCEARQYWPDGYGSTYLDRIDDVLAKHGGGA